MQIESRNGRQSLNRFLFVAFLLLLAFAFQGTRGLYEPDEGRYVNVSLEMLRSGDWLVPHRHPETPHLTKPPITYWAVASSILAFGRNEWAARLPNTLAFFFTCLIVYAVANRLKMRRPWLPPLIYATSLLPFVAENIVTTDTLLTLWETAAVGCYVAAWTSAENRESRRWILLMWAAFGVAFMTKGPPGLLPLAGILTFSLLCGRRGEWRRVLSLPGLFLFLLVGLPWYLAIVLDDPSRLRYFLMDEVVGRVATDEHHRNAEWYGAFMIYIPTLLLGTLPWGIVLIGRGSRILSHLKRFRHSAYRSERPVYLFLLCWTLVPLVIFALARSRLPLYLLPLFAPISLAAGLALQSWKPGWKTMCAVTCWVLLLITLKAAPGVKVLSAKDSEPLAATIRSSVPFEPSEIVFIDTTAVYGLSFYLNCDIECVTTVDPARLEKHCDSTLKDELGQKESHRVWVTKHYKTERVQKALAAGGVNVRVAGRHGIFTILVPARPTATS